MDFEIPEDLKMVQSLVRDFVTDQLKPLERSILGRAADLSDAKMYLPQEKEHELMEMVKEMGLWGIGVPQEFGGAGLSILGNCLVEEELAQTIVPFNFGDVTPILFECNEQQKEKYLLPVLNKQKCAYLALMEPGKEASDIDEMEMWAEKANSYYIISGKKASFSRAGKDYFALVFGKLVQGRRSADKGPREGVTCFLIDKDTPGFTLTGGREKTGWEAGMTEPVYLSFDNCKVPCENVLGEEGKAFHLGKKWLPARRIMRGARCIGAAQRILEESTTQAQTWTSFGQTISGRPSIQAALGDIATNIHASRLMVYEAAWKADKGQSIQREAAMVKLFATQMIHFVADNAAHIFNAPPYVAGVPMERFCRNALAMSSTNLALQLQRNIIARDILKGLKI
ncbi:MAG: acyl-CoA dehydrogenase family protein [Dehalococcoidia bacterium]|nr:acyl-CoA dehydrogenase family protein [Dehalococcoidia bacterium]